MSARQGTEGAQSSRRSARLKKTVTLEPIPETGTISGSPTPTWSREISPAHPPGGSARPEKELFEEGEDEFMPTTQEVAETLARMKSGAVAIDRDRGDEVRLPLSGVVSRFSVFGGRRHPPKLKLL